MIPLKSTFIFLVFSATLVSQVLAQFSPAAPFDASSLPNQSTITLEPIIIDDPSVTFDEIDQAGEHRSITAAEYADFLNSKAVTDAENLYDEKMGSDLEDACIIRIGLPGDYSYEVIAGREDFSVTYLTQKSAGHFLEWLESSFAKTPSKNNNELPGEQNTDQLDETDLSAEAYNAKENDFLMRSNNLSYYFTMRAPVQAPCSSSETNTQSKAVFSYTSGATLKQTVFQGIGLYMGGLAGISLLLPLAREGLATLLEGAAFSCYFYCAAGIIVIIFIPLLIYLGEKLGQWLGS